MQIMFKMGYMCIGFTLSVGQLWFCPVQVFGVNYFYISYAIGMKLVLKISFAQKNPMTLCYNKRAQRALGRSPEEKVKGQGKAIYRGPLMLSTKYW